LLGSHTPLCRSRSEQGGRHASKARVITIEELRDPDVAGPTHQDARQLPAIAERLNDSPAFASRRWTGIDMQVLSHANPGLQKMEAETAVRLARIANDRLRRAHPSRFAARHPTPTRRPRPMNWIAR
jgi:hypothetical protein